MRILITGGGGLLATAIKDLFNEQEHTVVALVKSDLDITDAQSCVQQISDFEPDLVINAAAMTNVDGCETDEKSAFKINSDGARNVARAAQNVKARLVHISTDFVFDGTKREPYDEHDQTNPINSYGASKRAGELAALETCERSYIVRTSWLYGKAGKCFPKTILKLAATRPEFDVVADQIGCPTYVVDLAKTISLISATTEYGVYHAANSGECSWHEFAEAILKLSGINGVVVNPIPASAWPSPAARPAYSVLRSIKLPSLGIAPMRPWIEGLSEFAQIGHE